MVRGRRGEDPWVEVELEEVDGDAPDGWDAPGRGLHEPAHGPGPGAARPVPSPDAPAPGPHDPAPGAPAHAPGPGPDGSGAVPTPDASQSTPGRGARWSRGLRVVGVVAVVLVLGVAYAVQGAVEQRRQARLAALDGLVGVSLAEPLTEQWRVEGRWTADVADGVVLASSWETGALRAFDAQDGRQLWEHGTRGPMCTLLHPTAIAPLTFEGGDGAPVVLCFDPELIGDVGAGSLVVLDPRTGEDRDELVLDGPIRGLFPLDGDLVVVEQGRQGALVVQRWSLDDGTVVWRYESPPGVADDAEAPWAVRFGTEAVSLGAGGPTVDLRTGVEVGADRLGDEVYHVARQPLPSGGGVVWEYLADGTTRGSAVDDDGRVRFGLEGMPLVPRVDDGAVPEVLLVGMGVPDRLLPLRGVSLADGATVWESTTLRADGVLLRLGGAGLVEGAGRVTSVDLADGSERWSVPVVGGLVGPAVTDGEVVLLPEVGDGVTSLVARRVDDGAALWDRELPDRSLRISGGAGQVLLATEDALIALG